MTNCACGGAHQAAATEPLDAPFPVPAYPPRAWFEEKPDWLVPGTDLHVDDNGRVAGYFMDRGSCLVHNHNACPQPSPTGYAAFMQQHLIVEDGSEIRVGVIGNVGGHADPTWRWDAASAHYSDPNLQKVVCRAYDDEHGAYILGAMIPGSTYGDVSLVRLCSLSGDWRPMPPSWWLQHGISAGAAKAVDFFDCVGPTLVTRPGLPMVERRQAALLGGCGGIDLPEEETMSETTIEVPGGITIRSQNATTTPGPHPAPAVVAAPPPPPPPPAEEEESGGEVTREEFDALVERVQQIGGLVEQLANAQQAAMEASVPPLPPKEEPPFEETEAA
jgi:hypothetical protein